MSTSKSRNLNILYLTIVSHITPSKCIHSFSEYIRWAVQAPTYISELTCHAGIVVKMTFTCPTSFLVRPKQVITYARIACIIYHGFNDLKTIFFLIVLHCCIFLSISAIFYIKLCRLLRKSACAIGQVETKMYLSESPFLKKKIHLPRQAGKYLCQCLQFKSFYCHVCVQGLYTSRHGTKICSPLCVFWLLFFGKKSPTSSTQK